MAYIIDSMTPGSYEKQISQVACLLDELAGKTCQRDWWNGYHPRVYCKINRDLGDQLVRELCSALEKQDVTQYSLEMQIWWRDHKAADKKRQEREAALAKLTQYERKLLGL